MPKIEAEEMEALDNDLASLPDEADDSVDWKAHAKKLVEKAIQRREKSKAFRQQYKETMDELATLKAKALETPPLKEKESKPTDTNYGLVETAFFMATGLKTPEEQQLARDFAKRTGESLDKVVNDDIFTARLEKLRTTTANAAASDISKGRTAHDTDIVAKTLAGLKPNDQIPADLPREVREKLVDARLKKGKDTRMFYSD